MTYVIIMFLLQTSFIEEEVQEDASSSFGTDNKKTLGTASARPAPSQSINRPLLPVPPGWIDSVDPYTEEVFYINSLNGERVSYAAFVVRIH